MSTLAGRMADMDPAGIVWDDPASTRFAAAKRQPNQKGAANPAAPTGSKKPSATSPAASTAADTVTSGKTKAHTRKKRRAADIFKAANRTATNK
jgi:hypothetical protein